MEAWGRAKEERRRKILGGRPYVISQGDLEDKFEGGKRRTGL